MYLNTIEPDRYVGYIKRETHFYLGSVRELDQLGPVPAGYILSNTELEDFNLSEGQMIYFY
jgi:hypothetical protein